MNLHAVTQWHQEDGEPFDAIARARFRARPEFSALAHLSDAFERGYETPLRARHRAAHAAALAKCGAAASAGGAGLVSVPTSWKTDLVELKDSADFVVCTDEANAKRRLAKLRCAVGFAARAHAVTDKGHRSDKCWMVTLTYRPGCDWSPKHVSAALLKARDWCRKKGVPFRYVWIAEMQDGKRRADGIGREVIHYHVALWLPVGTRCPHFDARGWWPYGMTQSQEARGAVGYLMHYLKKDKDLSTMPKGARAYGVGGLDLAMRRARRWLGLPAFVQGNSSIWDQWKRAPGGGWIAPGGAHYASEFERCKVGGFDALRRVHRHPVAITAAGPFSWMPDASPHLQ